MPARTAGFTRPRLAPAVQPVQRRRAASYAQTRTRSILASLPEEDRRALHLRRGHDRRELLPAAGQGRGGSRLHQHHRGRQPGVSQGLRQRLPLHRPTAPGPSSRTRSSSRRSSCARRWARSPRRLRFTPFVLKLPVRPPVLVAKQAASVATLTGNRLALGVGISPWRRGLRDDGRAVRAARQAHGRVHADRARPDHRRDYFEFHGEFYDIQADQDLPDADRADSAAGRRARRRRASPRGGARGRLDARRRRRRRARHAAGPAHRDPHAPKARISRSRST